MKTIKCWLVGAIVGFVSLQLQAAVIARWQEFPIGSTSFDPSFKESVLSWATLDASAATGAQVLPLNTTLAFTVSADSTGNGSTLTFTFEANTEYSLTGLTFDYLLNSSSSPNTINWTIGGSSAGTSMLTYSAGPELRTDGAVSFASPVSLIPGEPMSVTGTLAGASGVGNITFGNFGVSAVPEPSTLALALLGLLTFALRRRR